LKNSGQQLLRLLCLGQNGSVVAGSDLYGIQLIMDADVRTRAWKTADDNNCCAYCVLAKTVSSLSSHLASTHFSLTYFFLMYDLYDPNVRSQT
jgi:hypothetical protein